MFCSTLIIKSITDTSSDINGFQPKKNGLKKKATPKKSLPETRELMFPEVSMAKKNTEQDWETS
jgi:hypothetical protein